jgi:DNA-binding MarR family transcriptional regulator
MATQTPAPHPLDRRINYRLNQISHHWSAVVVAMARSKYQLNPTGMRILSVIACYQPVSPSELVEHTSSDSPKVARAVGYLAEQRLIERVPDPQDGRRAILRLTTKGARVNADIDTLSQAVEARVLSALTESDRQVFYAVLDKIEASIDQQLRGASWTRVAVEAPADTAVPTLEPAAARRKRTAAA